VRIVRSDAGMRDQPDHKQTPPVIAMTTTTTTVADSGSTIVTLTGAYIEAIERMRGAPLLLSPVHTEHSLEHLIGLADGLVLTGGEDVDPSFYGHQPHPELGVVNIARDRMEFAVLKLALERRMPVLAICRGIQLLNVAFGGTLFQHLPAQRAEGVIHEQPAPINERWHAARVAPSSRLAEIFGATELFINSFHHQGIDHLGKGLRPVVWAEDGLIEGVEAEGHPWVMGVQWHPERGEAESPHDRRHPDTRLFYAFVEAARGYRDSVLDYSMPESLVGETG
jgi:putative glutamine amidotransferase